jgi:hypothetical protein
LVGAVASAGAKPGCNVAWTQLEKRLELVTKAAADLGSRIPRVREPRLALTIAHGLDTLLCNIAVGYNALELAIGDGLAALETGRRAMDLKYSNVDDYAREELDMNASTAAKKARLSRRLRERPLLREAFRLGEITPRKAEVIAKVAVGDQEAHWVLRAKVETVRALQKAVNAPPDPEDERLMSATAAVPEGKRCSIQEGLRWGGIVLGQRSTRSQRVEAWAQEYYGGHPAPPEDACENTLNEVRFREKCEEEMDSLKERLEQESRLWADLLAVDPLQAVEFSGEVDPWRIDAELKKLMKVRRRWDEVFGHVALLFKRCGAWEPLEFNDFPHYCEERLGMARRTVMQRVALERSLLRMPYLRQALRDGQVTYEQARLIARHVEAGHAIDLRPLIAMAQSMTCVDLREALTVAEGQMCARGIFTVTAPPDIFDLLLETLRMARVLAGQSISLGKCLVEMAEHFVAVWKAHVKLKMTKRMRIFGRDRYRCQVPGCSRPAVHQHHLEYQSQGGSDDEANLLCLCAAHHLFGIHEERLQVTGTAPDKLVWEFGLRRSWAATAVP